MAGKKRSQPREKSDTEVRQLMLNYFYDRNKKSTSKLGKKGSAVKTRDLKSELKALHGLSQQQVQSNLTYLLSQGWVEEKAIEKSFTPSGGSTVKSTTNYYLITAQGIDKIDGPGEFTMDRFHGIRIEATGQNIITVGDGNRVKAEFGNLAEALAELRNGITSSAAEESEKLTLVADVETIQTQLVKPTPNKSIIAAAWNVVKGAAAINGCATLVARVAALIAPLLQAPTTDYPAGQR